MEQRRQLANQTRELLTRIKNRIPAETALSGVQGTRCREIKPWLRQFLIDRENDFQDVNFSDLKNLSDATHSLTEWSKLHEEADALLSLCTRRLAACPKEVVAVREGLLLTMMHIAKLMTRAIVKINSL